MTDKGRGMRQRAIAMVLALLVGASGLALVLPADPAQAWPGEDGMPAGPSAWYSDTPDPNGWHTAGTSDRVYDIAQIGDTVYVAGHFPALRAPDGTSVPRAHLAAFDAATGALIPSFAPVLNDAVFSLAVAPDGSSLYAAGAFTSVNGASRPRIVSLNPATGAVSTGWTAWGASGRVRSVVRHGPHLYIGGEFLGVGSIPRTRLARLDATTGAVDLTWQPSADGGLVYTLEMPSDGSRLYVGGRFTSVNGQPGTAELAAVDTTTGAVIPSFAAQPGREVFDLLADDQGRVWVAEGGPLGRAEVYRASNGSRIARWENQGDVQSVEQIGDRVYFGGHDFGPTEEQWMAIVESDDLSTWDTQGFIPPLTGGDGIWAFHSTGNWLWIGGWHTSIYRGFGRYPAVPAPPEPTHFVTAGSTWRYRDTGVDPGTSWNQDGYADSTWTSGAAQLGFGDGDETTVLRTGFMTYWFRRTFDVADASAVESLTLDVLADDGAVVYVNGVEVARDNMPTGAITADTPASTNEFGASETLFTEFSVPPSALRTGTNTIAVEVHQNYRSSSDLSFDLRLDGVEGTPSPDTTAPTVPANVTSPVQSETSFDLTWDASTDAVGVDHYEVFVDGTSAATTTDPAETITGLTPGTAYSVEVEALDAAGNRSGRSPAISVSTEASDPGPDGTSPSVPANLASPSQTETSVDLSWDASTDNVGVDHYDVFLDGTLAGPTVATSTTISNLSPGTTYSVEVEAVDAAGNRSGRSPALSVSTTAASPTGPVELVAQGASWRYLDDDSDQGTAWRQPTFVDSAWSQGPAQLGFGENDEATRLTTGRLTYYFRHGFSVSGAAGVQSLSLDLLVDDGAVVYLNGVELTRDNMPAGTISAGSYAATGRWGAEERWRTFTAPASALVEGNNVLAVEVHQDYRGSGDLSFDLRLIGQT